MRILGIDPGLSCTGYGIVQEEKDRLSAVAYGAIRTKAKQPAADRLHRIYTELQIAISQYQPDIVAVEEVFLAHNVKAALKLGQARGAAIIAGAACNLLLFEYSALEVKQAVVGYGRADKYQVQTMVRAILNLDRLPEPHDAADALAVAICHIHSMKIKARCEGV